VQLYARRSSSNCQKVLWMLGELELDYELIPTGGDAGGLTDPRYLELNPNGRVPTWVEQWVEQDRSAGDGGERGRSRSPSVAPRSAPPVAVWESHAILRYLAAAHAPERFWPADPAERSRIDRWLDWSQGQFDRYFMELFWAYWRTPAQDRNQKLIARDVAHSAHYLTILDGQLAGQRFVCGDELSLADIPIGALMYRYTHIGITAPLPEHVAAWYERLTQRPAFREHVMLPFDELRGRLAF